MDVFLMVRRKKTSIFLDAKESTSVLELKKMVRGITKRAVEDMKLYKDDQPIEDSRMLGEVGFTSSTARAQTPATVGLAFRQDDGSFETLDITELSTPPDLPEVMKPQDSASHIQD
jgi:transcription elongation factor B subunit 2